MTITRGSGNVFDDLEIPDPKRSVIEHVALALRKSGEYDLGLDIGHDQSIALAQAAIKATLEKMKEPSEAMLTAAELVMPSFAPLDKDNRKAWQAMLEQFEKELD